MALWKEQSNTKKDVASPIPEETPMHAEPFAASEPFTSPAQTTPTPKRAEGAESVIGADLAIEGSIVGTGNVRLAGRFTGDVTVEGVVTIEPGAKLAGSVRATSVQIAGELEGNVVDAERVDILASGVLMGDLKAKMLTLAAGSRVRGHIECGWVDATGRSSAAKSANGATTGYGDVKPFAPVSSSSVDGDYTVGAEHPSTA